MQLFDCCYTNGGGGEYWVEGFGRGKERRGEYNQEKTKN